MLSSNGLTGTPAIDVSTPWTFPVIRVSSDPPNRRRAAGGDDESPHRVRQRHVFYCMGYDPQGPGFYHTFFQQQFEIFCNRFGLLGSVSRKRDDADGICSHWNVRLSDVDWDVRSNYTFFRWDDLVAADLKRPLLPSLKLKALCDLDAIFSGTIFQLIRLNWRFGLASVYPTLAILALLLLAMAIGGFVGLGLVQLGLPWWVALPPLPLMALGVFVGGYRLLSKKCFLHLLVADGVFSMQHARGKCHDYLQRVDEFADELVRSVRLSQADEVVVVGHSSGSFCAIEVLARALRKAPDLASHGPRLSLLTLGANLPLIGCHPQAASFRADVALLAESPDVYWLEYQSPLDLLSFPSFDPGRVLIDRALHDRQMNPTVHSAHIQQSMEPRVFARNRFNFWRLHFQYLMAVDRLVPCDYMMVVAGPAYLEHRGMQPAAAMQLCYADGSWLLDGGELQPMMPLPPGRRTEPRNAVPVGGSRVA